MNPYAYVGITEVAKSYYLNKPSYTGRLSNLDVKYLYKIAREITGCIYEDIQTRLRYKDIVESKRLVMHYLRDCRGMTLTAIAKYFNCDHATVLNHTRNMKGFLEINDEISVKTYSQFRHEANKHLRRK